MRAAVIAPMDSRAGAACDGRSDWEGDAFFDDTETKNGSQAVFVSNAKAADAPPSFLPEGQACVHETPYRVFDDVFCIRANNPSPMAFEGTNTWIIHPHGASSCAVIDPGHDSAEHIAAIEAFARSRGARIREVVITHGHPDHVAGSEELVRRHGARLLSHGNGTLCDGPVALCGGAVRAHVFSLPGHSSDSMALLLEDDAALVSGDIFFSRGWSVIPAPDGDLHAYFDTLERIRGLIEQGKVRVVLPGHREVMDGHCALSRLDEYIEHRKRRLDEVRIAMERIGSRDVETLARQVYADVANPKLYEAALMSLASQVAYLNYLDGLA